MERPDSRSLPTLEVCAIATPPKATDAGTLSEIQTGLNGLYMSACDRAGSSQTALHIGAGSSELPPTRPYGSHQRYKSGAATF